jgi:DNA-binding response OmpR family regulator
MLLNVLIVQEDPRVVSFIKRGLEAEGFAVRTACDGADGLRLSRSLDFDLIVPRSLPADRDGGRDPRHAADLRFIRAGDRVDGAG